VVKGFRAVLRTAELEDQPSVFLPNGPAVRDFDFSENFLSQVRPNAQLDA
jgi:hypothetical protein